MLTASVENMLVTSIDTKLETDVVPTQYIVIISTVRQQSEVGIQRWIDVGPIVKFCLSIVYRLFFNSVRIFVPGTCSCTEKKILLNQKHFFPKACISWIKINML